MNPRQWHVTWTLLHLLQALEAKNEQLKGQGITMLLLEDMQADVFNAMLDANHVSREDPAVDWFCHPAYQMMYSEIDIDACIREMQKRHAEIVGTRGRGRPGA